MVTIRGGLSESSRPVAALYREELLYYNEPFILSHGEAMTKYVPYYIGVRRVEGLELPPERTIVLNRGTFAGRSAGAAFKQFGLIAPWFLRAVRKMHPVLVHGIIGVSGAQALPLARRLRVPLLVTCTGFETTASREELAKARYQGRVYLRRLDALKREARMFLAVSDYIRQRLLAQGFPESKTVVHYIGIDTTLFRADPEVPREPVVLFIGRLIPTKGVPHLIRAMARVVSRVPGAALVVIGRGARGELQRLASDLRVPVQFLGAQPPDQVRAWMNRATVLCTPSVPAPNGTVEALPAVCAEAQAMGLPVCGFASGGIPEGVAHGETGFLAPEHDEDTLAAHIERLLTDRPLWLRFSRAAEARARERFDLQRQARGLEAYYDQARDRSL
jgi:colanic acid/amylovoran biosynthesis glycosyltransferase